MVVPEDKTTSLYSSVYFPPPEWETEGQRYGLAAASTTESANTKIVGTENSVACLSIIKYNKTSLKYTHKKPFAKLLSPPSKSYILSCH